MIGYSFHEFNRDIDSQILRAMSKLKEVRVQNPDAQRIAAIVEEIVGNDVQIIVDDEHYETFYVPTEF